jgi:RHS repeat-associated protein
VSSTSNRLTSVSGSLTRSYSYDDAGNTTNDGAATFVYNDAGRMVSVTKAGTTTTYVLNALGERVKKTSGGTSRYFVYDESGHLLGEYDNAGALIQETLWFGDTPVATIRPNGSGVSVFYVHSDHLNTPRRITRPSDNVVVWRWDSDPFGATEASEDPDGDGQPFTYNLRFPGQYFDLETRLHYNYFRDYDPATGRYVQSDPIGLKGGINTYTYVGANPLSLIDPEGLSSKSPYPLLPSDWDWIPKPTKNSGYPSPPNKYPSDHAACKRICDAMLTGMCLLQGNLLDRGKCVADWKKWCMECVDANACLPPVDKPTLALASVDVRRWL